MTFDKVIKNSQSKIGLSVTLAFISGWTGHGARQLTKTNLSVIYFLKISSPKILSSIIFSKFY